MIKVNLLNTKVAGETNVDLDHPIDPSQFNIEGGSGVEETKLALTKLGLIFLFVIGLAVYEHFHISSLNSELVKARSQDTTLKKQVETGKKENEKALETQKKNDELQKKLEVLNELGKKRIRELKALDYFQSVIPEKVWLSKIDYKSQVFSIEGYAITDDDLTQFLQEIEKRPYFKDVILAQAREEKNEKGFMKSFLITTKLEEVE